MYTVYGNYLTSDKLHVLVIRNLSIKRRTHIRDSDRDHDRDCVCDRDRRWK